MTENEAKEILDGIDEVCGDLPEDGDDVEIALMMAKDALAEIQQYRAIGTVEELQDVFKLCESLEKAVETGNALVEELKKYQSIGSIEEFKALKEKNVAKKATKIVKAMNAFTEWGKYECPCCKNYLGNLNEYSYPNYCYKCGTEIDWQ